MFHISDLSAAPLLYREVKDEFALALTRLRPYLPLVCPGRVRARGQIQPCPLFIDHSNLFHN
jgi:hypothetical protein